jgi:tetratricopeptide (TPR) repeat protein
MAREITPENYRRHTRGLESEMERLRRAGHKVEARYSTDIASLHWEFGSIDEAREWYDRAISAWRREVGDQPAVTTACLFWRMGRRAEMESECRRVMARSKETVSVLEAAPQDDQRRRQLAIEYFSLAAAAFLLGDYAACAEWATKAETIAVGSQAAVQALREVAVSLKHGDAVAFEEALRSFRSLYGKNWPNASSGPPADLFRVALALCPRILGRIPEDLERELFNPGTYAAMGQQPA